LLALGAASVRLEACDVGEPEQCAALLEAIRRERPLTAIIHLAAVLDDGVLRAQDPDRFARVFGPKLGGALALDALTRGDSLTHFVMFSSVAGTIGAAGQAPYAAANAALDALAVVRRQRGLAAHSLAW